ncbi:MAG TPA: ROK family protein [Polyangiaceae bacterium]|nr:ROK family protein [Polyangiaceae bacterium]
MTPDRSRDPRVVMTLDAGGTSLRFCAMRGNAPVTERVVLPSEAQDLGRCLANIVHGFTRTRDRCPEPPVAISFGFPGPADYRAGIIGDLPNLPAFRGGVALGPMLEEKFAIPTFINNDGSLFAYGEAIAGFLPHVNGLLAAAGSSKRYASLVGITLGTGLGGGIVCDGSPLLGDNSGAGQIWLLRNKLERDTNAEEGACIRAVRRAYAQRAGIDVSQAPRPKDLFEIGTGARPGHKAAALEAFRRLGEVAGDALAQALTLVDGLGVVGGGIAGASSLFLPALVDEMNGTYADASGRRFRRLGPVVFNLEDTAQREAFVRGGPREMAVPGSARRVQTDALARVGVGISRLGTSEAVSVGAYAFALQRLDGGR